MPAYRCPEPFFESDSSSGSANSGDDLGASLRRYKALLADRLGHTLLDLPPSTDGDGDDDDVDGPDLPPSGEILQALTLPSFLDDELGDALLEYQVQKYLSDETYRQQQDSEEPHSAMYTVDDDIPYEEFVKDAKLLRSRRTLVDEYVKLDPEEVKEHELKRALYRIKACLWSNIETKARYQAIKIATEFENVHFDLAILGIEEFLWSTRLDVYNLKDLDSVFFEIWKRIINEENAKDCFGKALKEVYDLKMFPSRERSMKYEEIMAEKLAMTQGYEHYAMKKLEVAEYIGLIGKAST
ncbi:unnamed protein product [Alopecurus aequalis]